MKKTIEITINGESYPCSMTMGAMMRFKEVTGHEVPQFDSSVKDICAFIWALVSSCAKRVGKKFDMDFWDFCDSVDPAEMSKCWEALQAQQQETGADGEEKKKRVGIFDLLGLAIGRIRMSYDDFCRCTPEEFQAICKAWSEGENENYKAEWERVRTLAAITIQPHCKNRITPKKLLSFPWDRLKTTETREAESLTPEEKLKRFETLKDRLDGKQ